MTKTCLRPNNDMFLSLGFYKIALWKAWGLASPKVDWAKGRDNLLQEGVYDEDEDEDERVLAFKALALAFLFITVRPLLNVSLPSNRRTWKDPRIN